VKKLCLPLVVFVLVLFAPLARAHHPSHGASLGTSSSHPFILGADLPRLRLSYNFEWLHLDNDAGNLFLQQLSGEVGVLDWLSVTARVPVNSLQLSARPDKTGLGDIAVGGKLVLFDGPSLALIFGTDLTFPSGSRSSGTGSGSVSSAHFLSLTNDWDWLTLFAGAGTQYLWDNNPEPTLSINGGLAVPIKRKNYPISFFTSVDADIVLADEVFTSGSAKVYLRPGFIFYTGEDKRLSLTVSGKFSIADSLEVKAGQAIASNSLALTKDSFAGVNADIHFSF
jgi:hypothetical protein